MKEKIIALIKTTFAEEISTTSANKGIISLESWIVGEEEFVSKLAEKLTLLLSNKPIPTSLEDRYNAAAGDLNTRVKLANEATDPEILIMLAHDIDARVRHDVACNKSTPVKVLDLLAKSPSFIIRFAVASHNSTSAETLAMLAKDVNISVSNQARCNSNYIELLIYPANND